MGVFGARRLIGTFATAAAAIAVLSSCRTTPEASSPEPPAPEPTAVARQYWIGTVTYVTELDGVQMRDGTIVTGEATITWIFDDYPLHPGGATDAHLRMALDLSRVRDCRTTRTVVDVDTTVSAGRIVGRDSQDLGYVRPASMDIRHHNEIGTLRTESSSCDPPSSTATERPYVTMPPHLDLMVGFPLGDRQARGVAQAGLRPGLPPTIPGVGIALYIDGLEGISDQPGDHHRIEYDLMVSPCTPEDLSDIETKDRSRYVSRAAQVIGEASPTFESSYTALKGKVKFFTGNAPNGTVAQAGADDSGNIGFSVNWSAPSDQFRVGHAVAHEYAHLGDAAERGFTSTQAAAHMTRDQYIAHRWQSEKDAYAFQAKVLAEVAQNAPHLAGCIADALGEDPLLRDGLPEAQRDALVRDRYAEADLAREWEQHRTDSGNPDLREAVRDYVASPQFKQHQEHWARP